MQDPPPIPVLLAELAAFCREMAAVLADERRDWLWRPSADEWSLTEVACHLRDVEREVHQVRIRALIHEDDAFMPGIDSDEWARQRHYRLQDGRAAMADFIAAREETIAMLAPLPADVWNRKGQHTFFGPTSMSEIIYLAVQHDRTHAHQIDALNAGATC